MNPGSMGICHFGTPSDLSMCHGLDDGGCLEEWHLWTFQFG